MCSLHSSWKHSAFFWSPFPQLYRDGSWKFILPWCAYQVANMYTSYTTWMVAYESYLDRDCQFDTVLIISFRTAHMERKWNQLSIGQFYSFPYRLVIAFNLILTQKGLIHWKRKKGKKKKETSRYIECLGCLYFEATWREE